MGDVGRVRREEDMTLANKMLGKKNNSIVLTPNAVADDLVDMIPEELFNSRTTFIDICCKSGIILKKIYRRLIDNEELIQAFPSLEDRQEYIIENQLYGICYDQDCANVAREKINGVAYEEGNIICIPDLIQMVKNRDWEKIRAKIKERSEFMKFDVVIGNPPYNNDVYIPFVEMGHSMSTECSIWVTPAKWQAKGGKLNEEFRSSIVPYMKDIVYYKDTHDIFDIDDNSGMTYYLVDKNKQSIKNIKNKCAKNSVFESDWEEHDETEINLNNRKILKLIGKIGTLGGGFKQSLYVKNTDSGESVISGTLGGGFKQSLYVKNTDSGESVISGTLGFKRFIYGSEQDRGDYIAPKGEYVEVMQGQKVVGYKLIKELFTTYNIDKFKCITSCMVGGGTDIRQL